MSAVLFFLLKAATFRTGRTGPHFVWNTEVLQVMNCNTRRAYVGALRRLEKWLDGQRLTDERLAGWIADLAICGRTAASAVQTVSAVKYFARHHGFESPVGPRTATALNRTRRETAGCGRGQVLAATRDDVEQLLSVVREPRTYPSGRRESVRRAQRRTLADLALIAVLYLGGLRASEAALLRWTDVTAVGDGEGIRIWVRRSKSNPYGAQSDVRFVKGVFAESLLQWREADGAAEGDDRLAFGGLTAATLSRRVAAAADYAGLKKRLTAHSFRVGLAVELTRLGASMQEIMHAGNWKSPGMVAQYSAAARATGGAVARLM